MESLEIVSCAGKTGIRIKGKSSVDRQPIHTILCVDTSASMEMDNKLENVKKSLNIFTKCLTNGDAVSLITFDSSSKIILKAVVVSEETRPIIEDALKRIRTDGSTNMSAGLLNCFNCVEESSPRTQGILLLTDGNVNVGETNLEKIVTMSSVFLRKNPGLTLTTIAYGLDHNAELLKSLATTGLGSYNLVENLEDVATVFGSVLGTMLSIVCQNICVNFTGESEMITAQEIVKNDGENYINIGDLHSEETIVAIMKSATISSHFSVRWYDPDEGILSIKKEFESLTVDPAPSWFTLALHQQRVAKLIGSKCFVADIEAEIATLSACALCDHPIVKRLIQELLDVKKILERVERHDMSPVNATAAMIQRSCVIGLGRGMSSPAGRGVTEDPTAPQNSAMRQTSQYIRSRTLEYGPN